MAAFVDLSGKTALVSGSTVGIGFAIALGLAKQGARVIVNGRTQDRVDKAVEQIRRDAAHASVVGIAADLATTAGAAAVFAAHPVVDVLVNNLGIAQVRTFEATTDEDWLHHFHTNVVSGIRLSRLYLPHMRAQNWGRIIFIASLAAEAPGQLILNYSVTKAAQVAFARGLAEALAGTNITVNSVIVGPTNTDAGEKFLQDAGSIMGAPASQVKQLFVDSTLVKRFMEPTEIASMVVYLASPAASGTTGAALRVDGGAVHHI